MTETLTPAPPARIFRGWWVLSGIFLAMTVGSGFAFYAQGVFLDALVEEQGFSVGMAGAGTGLFFVVSGIAGYYAGGLISRFDIRAVMVVGATVAAIGIALLGQVRNVWQMFAVFFIYGAGYALAGLVPATSLVTRWFHVRRSIALSIASTGLSVGGIAITPVLAHLIDRESLAAMATRFAVVYWLALVPTTLLLLRPSPERLGLRPDGAAHQPSDPTSEHPEGEIEPPGMRFAEAVRTRYFRFLSAAFILIMGAQVGALQHIFKLTKDTIDINAANLALIVVTSTSVVARILGGLAASRMALSKLTTMLVVVQALGVVIIGSADQRWMILLGAVVLGSAMGNLLMLHPLLLAEAFGVRDYPRIYGLGSLLMIAGVGLGPFAVGLLRDVADYQRAFYVMAGVALVGLVVFQGAGSPDIAEAEPPAPPANRPIHRPTDHGVDDGVDHGVNDRFEPLPMMRETGPDEVRTD